MTKRVFRKNDLSSNDGMMTTIWGPSLWHCLHTISFNYPVEPTDADKKQYLSFIKNLKHILPCKHCRDNFQKTLDKRPITINDMKNRSSYSKYIYGLHEEVNKMLHKKSGLSYTDVRERYEHFRARCNKTVSKGCTEPLTGIKSKGIIKIIPTDSICDTIQIDKACCKIRNKTRRNKKTLT